MSKIKQVNDNLWIGSEEFGVIPHFKRTDHAIEHYPNGGNLIHAPVQPGNVKIHFDYDDEPDDPEYTGENSAKYLGEIFEWGSAGGHRRRVCGYASQLGDQSRRLLLHGARVSPYLVGV